MAASPNEFTLGQAPKEERKYKSLAQKVGAGGSLKNKAQWGRATTA